MKCLKLASVKAGSNSESCLMLAYVAILKFSQSVVVDCLFSAVQISTQGGSGETMWGEVGSFTPHLVEAVKNKDLCIFTFFHKSEFMPQSLPFHCTKKAPPYF